MRLEEFRPVPIAEQLAQRSAGRIELTAGEHRQGRLYVEATAEVIRSVAADAATATVRIGVGMPGLKTPDGRGISAINHGPRIPDFLHQLEGLLDDGTIRLEQPIRRLGSDADYCGLGEEFGEGGHFGGVTDAYYLGGGSGLAEAMKLNGRLVPFDQARQWMQKAWQMRSRLGTTFERLISPKGMNERYAAALTRPVSDASPRPEDGLKQGDAAAIQIFADAASAMAELVHERLVTLMRGRQAGEHSSEEYRQLDGHHHYAGRAFQKIVIGQVLGRLFESDSLRTWFREPFMHALATAIRDGADRELWRAYLAGDRIKDGLIVVSSLRAAPALGAAIDAFVGS